MEKLTLEKSALYYTSVVKNLVRHCGFIESEYRNHRYQILMANSKNGWMDTMMLSLCDYNYVIDSCLIRDSIYVALEDWFVFNPAFDRRILVYDRFTKSLCKTLKIQDTIKHLRYKGSILVIVLSSGFYLVNDRTHDIFFTFVDDQLHVKDVAMTGNETTFVVLGSIEDRRKDVLKLIDVKGKCVQTIDIYVRDLKWNNVYTENMIHSIAMYSTTEVVLCIECDREYCEDKSERVYWFQIYTLDGIIVYSDINESAKSLFRTYSARPITLGNDGEVILGRIRYDLGGVKESHF